MLQYITNPSTIAATLDGVNDLKYKDIWKTLQKPTIPKKVSMRFLLTFYLSVLSMF